MLEFRAFNREFVVSKLGEGVQAKYLASYLEDIKAKGLLVEPEYVDRHYLDDYRNYYARSFEAPSTKCERLHFFAVEEDEIRTMLEDACHGVDAKLEIEQKLGGHYLGFVVVRPLENARMGRTVLKTYPEDGRRRIEVVRDYRVNIAGLDLLVSGLAFQQQDLGAAVCASTALWSALQKVADVAGHRTPTPSAVTEASMTPFPALAGLDSGQMAMALSQLGYVAESFVPEENRTLFRARIGACLESGLPVILICRTFGRSAAGDYESAHAVTITGFRQPSVSVDVPPTKEGLPPISMKTGALDVIYVHDDNLGSHAHYELLDGEPRAGLEHSPLVLRRGNTERDPADWWPITDCEVMEALVPKPEKMRLPVDSLFENVLWFRSILEEGNVFDGLTLNYGMRLATGVSYKRTLYGDGIDRAALPSFLQGLHLPRHVGVICAFVDDNELLELVVDVSEVRRRADPRVLAMVGLGVFGETAPAIITQGVADELGCPFICRAVP